MKKLYFKTSFSFLFLLTFGNGFAQTGPGGVGTTDGTSSLKVWLRADRSVFTNAGTTAAANGQEVQQWNDQSGNNLHATQTFSLGSKPAYKATSFNGIPSLSFVDDRFAVPFDISPGVTPNLTVFVVASHTTTATTPLSKLFGNDDGGYDRAIGFDHRGSKRFAYFSGTNAIGFSDQPVPNTPFIVTANYTPTTFSGWMNGVQEVNNAGVSNGAGNTLLGVGGISGGYSYYGEEFWKGEIAEFIVFNRSVTKAERILVENYLSAKYATTLMDNDFYTMDNSGFDFDVIGIGQADDHSQITSASGGGVSVGSPTDLTAGVNEFLFIGHNKGVLSATTTDIPTGLVKRMGRTWAVSEVGEVGAVTLSIDLTGQPVASPDDLRLLIDTDKDGAFGDETGGSGIISGATKAGNVYTFANVDLSDGAQFTIGSVSSSTLPVTLASFDVTNVGAVNQLIWHTSSEQHTAFFEVQRSTDGKHFTTLGQLNAAGNSSKDLEYTFKDLSSPPGKVYYRLKMVDIDHQYKYSTVVSAFTKVGPIVLHVTPNPVIGRMVINGLKGLSFVQILNLNGGVVARHQTSLATLELDLTQQPAGTYFIQVDSDGQRVIEKIIKR